MSNFEEIKLYLPKYLSDEDTKKLFSELHDFPHNIDSRFYSDYLLNENEDIIFQGDGLKELTVANIVKKQFYVTPAIVLSNTCDIDISNKRLFHSNICYAPIMSLRSYEKMLLKKKNEETVENHLTDIRRQKITQIFYLPKGQNLREECIVFLDRISHCPNDTINQDNIQQQKIFILSDYGFYIFLVKISLHFTRIQEKVERR